MFSFYFQFVLQNSTAIFRILKFVRILDCRIAEVDCGVLWEIPQSLASFANQSELDYNRVLLVPCILWVYPKITDEHIEAWTYHFAIQNSECFTLSSTNSKPYSHITRSFKIVQRITFPTCHVPLPAKFIRSNFKTLTHPEFFLHFFLVFSLEFCIPLFIRLISYPIFSVKYQYYVQKTFFFNFGRMGKLVVSNL